MYLKPEVTIWDGGVIKQLQYKQLKQELHFHSARVNYRAMRIRSLPALIDLVC